MNTLYVFKILTMPSGFWKFVGCPHCLEISWMLFYHSLFPSFFCFCLFLFLASSSSTGSCFAAFSSIFFSFLLMLLLFLLLHLPLLLVFLCSSATASSFSSNSFLVLLCLSRSLLCFSISGLIAISIPVCEVVSVRDPVSVRHSIPAVTVRPLFSRLHLWPFWSVVAPAAPVLAACPTVVFLCPAALAVVRLLSGHSNRSDCCPAALQQLSGHSDHSPATSIAPVASVWSLSDLSDRSNYCPTVSIFVVVWRRPVWPPPFRRRSATTTTLWSLSGRRFSSLLSIDIVVLAIELS